MNKYFLVSILIFITISTSTVYGADSYIEPAISDIVEAMFKDKKERKYYQRGGYKNMAIDHFGSNLEATYDFMLENFGISYINELGWGQKHSGDIEEFNFITISSLNSNTADSKMYEGPNGPEAMGTLIDKNFLDTFVDDMTEETIEFDPVGLYEVLDDELRVARLEVIEKSADGEFESEKERFLSKGINGNYIYAGAEGYDAYSTQFYKGAMQKPFKNAKKLLTQREFDELGWGTEFRGKVHKYREIRYLIFGSLQNYKYGVDKWYGKMNGLARLTNEYLLLKRETLPFSKYLVEKTRNELRGALSINELFMIGWFSRSERYSRSSLVNFKGFPTSLEVQAIIAADKNKIYTGRIGYEQLAIDHFYGFLGDAYELTLKALGHKKFLERNLGLKYEGHFEQYIEMRLMIFSSSPSTEYAIANWYGKKNGLLKLVKKYISLKGNRQFSNEDVLGKFKASVSISESLQLGWSSSKKSVTKKPVTKKPVTKKAAAKKSVTKKSVTKKAAAKKTIVRKPKKNTVVLRKYPTIDQIKKIIFSDIDKKYFERAGYFQVALDHYDGKLEVAYNLVLKAVGKKRFLELNYGTRYEGSFDEYKSEKNRLFDEEGSVKHKYRDGEGYVQYSLDFYKGNMRKTFGNVMSVLSESQKAKLGWGDQYIGRVADQRQMRFIIYGPFQSDEYAIANWYGSDKGLSRLVNKYLALKNVSQPISDGAFKVIRARFRASVSSSEKVLLGWQMSRNKKPRMSSIRKKMTQFITPVVFQEYPTSPAIKEILSLDINKKYIERTGYLRIAEDYFNGNLNITYDRINKAIGKELFLRLGYGRKYQGTVTDYKLEKWRALSKNSRGEYIYRGPEGRIAYALDFYNGQMKKAFGNVMSMISVEEKEKLGWRAQYEGNVAEYRQLRLLIFGPSQDLQYAINRWFGKEIGLNALMKEYLSLKNTTSPNKNLINSTRKKLRAVVTEDELKILGWDKVSSKKLTAPIMCREVVK